MSLDRAPFLSSALTEEELKEISESSHSELLACAFKNLADELDLHGNSALFQDLRRIHAKKLLGFWMGKRLQYLEAQKDGRIKNIGEELANGDERLTVLQLGAYEDDEAQVLNIRRATKTESDEVSITAHLEEGIDEFISPPTIKSEITDPNEITDINYRVVFRRGRISTFERVLIRMDPQHKLPYIKDARTIDCSIFGVETS